MKALIPLMLLALVIPAAVWIAGSKNPETPAGYVGYLTQGAVLGKARFFGLQTGPTSPGRTWRMQVVNVSITPYTYNEEFSGSESVLSRDNLQVGFRVHVVWHIRADRVQMFIEKFSTLGPKDDSDKVVRTAYDNFLREPLRTYARDEIQRLDGLAIKDRITPVGTAIQDRLRALTADTPFEITSVVVGNIQYPAAVATAVAEKLAATQVLERKQTEIEIQKRDEEKRIVEANGIARAMQAINQSLTPTYLQHEAIEAQKAMVNSQNHTVVYLPVGNMGIPLVADVSSHTK